MKIKNFIWGLSVVSILCGGVLTSCTEDETTGKEETTDVTSVTISKDAISLDVAKTANLTATVRPSYATNAKVVWSTEDAAIATVSASGLVTAVAEGETNIVVSSESNPEVSDVCVVTVVAGGGDVEITGGGDPTTYNALKSYVNRAASPSFKLGAAVQSANYNTDSRLSGLINENYDEVVSTYHMKHGAVVGDGGDFDFSVIDPFIANAKGAGLSVFGHALCWHVGNNNTYLENQMKNSAAAAKRVINKTNRYFAAGEWVNYTIDGSCDAEDAQGTWTLYSALAEPTYKTEGDNKYISLETTAAGTAPNQSQFILRLGDGETPAKMGDTYKVSFKVRSSNAAVFNKIIIQAWEYNYIRDIAPWRVETTTEWSTFSFELPIASATDATAYRVAVSFGDAPAGTYDFDDVSVSKLTTTTGGGGEEPNPDEETWGELITNGDFEGETSDNFYAVGTAKGVIEGATGNPGRSYKVSNATAGEAPWTAQFKMDLQKDGGMVEGEIYKLSFDAKASIPTDLKLSMQNAEGKDIKAGIEIIKITEEYQTFEVTIDNTTGLFTTSSVFAFNFGTFVTDLHFDNVSVLSNKGGKPVDPDGPDQPDQPDPDNEYKQVVTDCLEEFIKGMVEHTKGDVKAWDVVNEPLDDSDVTKLKSDNGVMGNADFYWQDYMGENYVRDAVKFARQYGGNDLLLFINEYGLSWSHTNKCESLIKWIEKWESDGVTKIDGIASQMHISYYENVASQAKEEAAVVKMLELMSATGKLVKISELDMQYKNANGQVVKAEALTDDMHLAMAKYYQFIVSKYFEIVPAAQQYSITHWTPIDPSTSADWRGGEPVGLWTSAYERKQTYAGFAEGLDSNL